VKRRWREDEGSGGSHRGGEERRGDWERESGCEGLQCVVTGYSSNHILTQSVEL